MKILYVAKVEKQLSGVNKKISDTISAWEKIGHIVELYNSLDINREKQKYSEFKIDSIVNNKYITYFYDYTLYKKIKDFNPDIIYYRFGPIPILQNFDSNLKIIVESNSNLTVEKKNRTFLQQLMINLYLLKFNRVSSGIIGVTPECLKGFERISKNEIIGNGIDFDETTFYNSLKSNRKNKERLKVVFLGSPNCPWHGLDKLTKVAKLLSSIDFTIIGYTETEVAKKSQAKIPNINYRGFLDGEHLSTELRTADLAIGSLAMERAGLFYSSSLKNRTYLQYALPIILQGIDIDLVSCPGIVSLPKKFNEKDLIDAINVLKGYFYTPNDMNIIKNCINSLEKEKERLKFFRQFI